MTVVIGRAIEVAHTATPTADQVGAHACRCFGLTHSRIFLGQTSAQAQSDLAHKHVVCAPELQVQEVLDQFIHALQVGAQLLSD